MAADGYRLHPGELPCAEAVDLPLRLAEVALRDEDRVSYRSPRVRGGSQPDSSRCRRELSIARDHNQVVDVQGERCSELNGFIDPQGYVLC